MKSSEFQQYLSIFSDEVHQATGCYVFWKSLQNHPADDKNLLSKLNEAPLSWNFIRHSLMVSLIMSLGRIFDTDADSISIDDLIKSCISDIDDFSKGKLKDRKTAAAGADTTWIDAYIDKAYQPEEKDFQILRPEIRKFRDLYQKFYRPLRHKIFAHSDKEYIHKKGELWQATKDANIEELLDFLTDLEATLRDSYNNGRKPELKGRKIDQVWYENDISKIFSSLLSAKAA
jgi:hypothetical protein